ncbi:hypothetical protein WA577_005401 [Blastocystis sp. JDR]
MSSRTGDSVATDCVKVAVRVRPLVARERGLADIAVVADSSRNEISIKGNDDNRYTFNYVFGPSSTQEEVYNTCVTPLLESAFDGYNATILAYGQTGSGKTYTMGTAGRSMNSGDYGIVPRIIEEVFQKKEAIEGENEGNTVMIRVSFLEIYGDTVRDLLEFDQAASKEVLIRSDEKGGVKIIGHKQIEVNSADELLDVLDNGCLYRATGRTSMNAFSSRSHAIFTIYIDQELALPSEGAEQEEGAEPLKEAKQSKFHFVDLAGSERTGKANTEGKLMKEGININLGLLALGKVISALGDEKKKGTFPPYRESKLTRILMDSLGGNAKTLMITCVSPASDSISETVSSLVYANNAKNIQNKPKVNHDAQSDLIDSLRREIASLKQQLQGRGDVDEGTLEQLARMGLSEREEEKRMKNEEETRLRLEERVKEAESDAVKLGERLREVNRALEEEKNKNAVLTARLEVLAKAAASAGVGGGGAGNTGIAGNTGVVVCDVLGEELSPEALKEVDLLAKHKLRIAELEAQLQHKTEQVAELLELSEKQNQRSMADKMKLIDVTSKTKLELELEAVSRIKELLNGKGENEEMEEVNLQMEEVDSTIQEQNKILSQQLDTLVTQIERREKELVEMKKQQTAMENMSKKYEQQLNEMTRKIAELEAEKKRMLHERDELMQQHHRNPAGTTEKMARQQQQLENKLKSKTEEIQVIMSQKRELQRTVEGLRSTSTRISRLTDEIQEMKQQRVSLQRSVEQAQRQHKQELEEKRKEIQQLQRQTRQQTRQITELERSNSKSDSLLRLQMEQTAQLQKQLKDLKVSADVQRREHERYTKEDQKRIGWLEKQLKLQGRKDQQILRLEQRVQQKDQALQRMKELMKQQEQRSRRRVQLHGGRNAENEAIEKYEEEDLADSMAQAATVLREKVTGVEELEKILKDNTFSEEAVTAQLRLLAADEAHAMLCLMYKKLVDYSNELRREQMSVGEKEEAIQELKREVVLEQRRLSVQKIQYERVITQVKEEYEAKLLEIQKEGGDPVNKERIMVMYYKIKKSYQSLLHDYYIMREGRNRYRMLYDTLKELTENGEEGKSAAGVKTMNGATVNKDAFMKLITSAKPNSPGEDSRSTHSDLSGKRLV